MNIIYNKLDEKLYSEDKKSYEINKTSKNDNLITINFGQPEIKKNFSFLIGIFGELDNYSDNDQDYIKLTLDKDIIFGNTNGKLEIQSETDYDIKVILLKKFNTAFDDQKDNLSSYIYQIKINNLDPATEIKEMKLQLNSTGDYEDICLGFQKDSAAFYANNINILRNSINPTFDKNVYNLSDEDNKLINNYLFDDFSKIIRSGEKVKVSFNFTNDGKSNFIVNFSCIGPYQLNILSHIDMESKKIYLIDSFLSNTFLTNDYSKYYEIDLAFIQKDNKYTLNIFLEAQNIYFEFIDSKNTKKVFNLKSNILKWIHDTKDKYYLGCSINSRDSIDTIMYFKYFQTLNSSFYYLGAKSLSKDYLGICPFDGNLALFSDDDDLKNSIDVRIKNDGVKFIKNYSDSIRSFLYGYWSGRTNYDNNIYNFNLDLSKLKIDNKYKYDKFYMVQAHYITMNRINYYRYLKINGEVKNLPTDLNRLVFVVYEFDLINLKLTVNYSNFKDPTSNYNDLYSFDLNDNDNNLIEIHDHYGRTDHSNQYLKSHDFGLIFTKDKPEFFLDGFINNFKYPLIDGELYNGELELIGLQNTNN